MTTYVLRGGELVEKHLAPPPPRPKRSSALPAPQIMPDITGYVSPLSDPGDRPIWVDGRAARREDLKRNNCREVDPSEYKPDDPKTWKGRR